jgi:C1A family cysteine protease
MDIDQSGGGWQPDLPDHRDYTAQHAAVRKRLRRLQPVPDQDVLPGTIDWREYCAPVEEQGDLPTSSAHACAALVQCFERRASGQIIRPSRLFLHANATRLLRQCPDSGVGLRAVLKAMVRFGGPPEEYWPYRAAALTRPPPPFTYGFVRGFRKIRFVRLDGRQQTGEQTLKLAQSFLAAGFPFALGFPVSSAIGRDAEIPFPTAFDHIRAGMAAVAVGYDDGLRIHSDRGAILIRTPWGADWGDQGYGWLPYAFIRERVAVDLWTLLKRSWLRSDEFYLPSAGTAAVEAETAHLSPAGPSA